MTRFASIAVDAFRRAAYRRREYAIGILVGATPFTLAPLPGAGAKPVLTRHSVTDARAETVADPFIIEVGGEWHMFFEVLVNGATRKGEIGHATSRDGLTWKYRSIVLREEFHLSYPYVFKSGSDVYMIPEASRSESVRLYRADPFPSRWVPVKTLLTGPVLVDSSVFWKEGRWWMFTQTAREFRQDTLRLFCAEDVLGPWEEHPKSPVVQGDARIARPAGRVLVLDGRTIRFAQDCREDYGMSVNALEVLRLSRDDYEEIELPGNPFLAGSGRGWNRSGMHHVDAAQRGDGTWIAAVDGWSMTRSWYLQR